MSPIIKKGFLFCIGLAFSFGSSARAESSLSIASEVFVPGLNLTVNFTPHLEPTVEEFKRGTVLVLSAAQAIEAQGWHMTVERIAVGITGGKMAGGNVVIEDGKLYISALSGLEEVEKGLMSWVFTQTENPSFRFTAHNDPSIAEFKRAKQLVLTTMNHIHEQTGLKLAASLQYVGLTGKRMAGGNVVIEDGKLYVSAQADLTEVERKLIMLCK